MNIVEYIKNGSVILGSDGILYRFVGTDVSYSITGMTVRIYL